MYGQLLTFIVALLLFTIQEPGTEAIRPPIQTLSFVLAVFALFVLVCHLAFKPLNRALERGVSLAWASVLYHRVQMRLSVTALGALALDVYVFNIKAYFQSIPGFGRSFTLTGLIGLGLYLLHLAVVWFWAHPAHEKIHGATTRRGAFIKDHLSFHSALLIPWLLIALLSDALQFVRLPDLLLSEIGQILFFGLAFSLFLCFAPWLVVRLWGCEPLPPSPVLDELKRFCACHRFNIGDFLLWPLYGGDHLTAAVMGVLPRLRYILVTRGLLRLLSVDELKAVAAHEMGHVRHYHAFFYLVLFLCYAYLSSSYHDIILLLLLKQEPVLQWVLSSESSGQSLFSLVYSVPVIAMMVVYFRYCFGFFLRNSERQADLHAMRLIGHPFTLITSLQKIAIESGHIEDLPSWHHFSIRERIEFLSAAYENPELVRRHNRKLFGTAAVFITAVTLIASLGNGIRESETVQSWRHEVQLRVLEHQLNLQPGSPELYMAYSGMLIEEKRFDQARIILERAMEKEPEHPGVLNNLAWLYATAPPPLFDPQRALQLALKAATLKPEPYILDTLAECYYVNGLYREALLTIRHAISQKPEKMDYYLKQEKKFRKALEDSRRERSRG